MKGQNKNDDIRSFRDWLMEEALILIEAQEDTEGFKKTEVTSKKTESCGSTVKDKMVCILCNESHEIYDCKELTKMNPEQRYQKVKEMKLCFKCLKPGHPGFRCTSLLNCQADSCQGNHHTLLHNPDHKKNPSKLKDDINCKTASNNSVGTKSLRTVPVRVSDVKGKQTLEVMAVLDDCSSSTYIAEDLAAALKLTGKVNEVDVSLLGNLKHSFSSMEVDFKISSLDNTIAVIATADTIKEVTGKINPTNWLRERSKWEHLANIPFPKLTKIKDVKILIGVDNSDLHTCVKEVVGKPKEPVARLTPLGWTCIGNMGKGKATFTVKKGHAYFINRHESSKGEQTNDTMKQMWELEAVGLMPRRSYLYEGRTGSLETS